MRRGGLRYAERMQEWIEQLHWGLAILFFWCIGILRTSLVYGLGRAAAAGGRRTARLRGAFDTALYRRAESFVNSWGVLAVPACFVTVGFQTAVIITTGFLRMPLTRWIPAMLVGTLIWGIIYGTVGMAVVWAWLERPWILAAVALVVVLAITLSRLLPRVRRARRGGH